jgi:hypothetical protein
VENNRIITNDNFNISQNLTNSVYQNPNNVNLKSHDFYSPVYHASKFGTDAVGNVAKTFTSSSPFLHGLNPVIDSATDYAHKQINKKEILTHNVGDALFSGYVKRAGDYLALDHEEKEKNKKFIYDILKSSAISGVAGLAAGYFFPGSTIMGMLTTQAIDYASNKLLNLNK